MLLLIDMGNTRIKWALASSPAHARPEAGQCAGDWQATGVALHAEAERLLAQALAGQSLRQVVASNVAGAPWQARLEAVLEEGAGVPCEQIEWFSATPHAGGVRNCYPLPDQLGADRFASVIGARALYPGQPLLVVTCGTATTIDALSSQGEFLGGMILPGLGLMAQALAGNTAQLPRIGETIDLPSLFADNTQHAIVSGCLNAHVGAIGRAAQGHPEAGAAPVHCLLSGGAGAMVAPYLATPATVVENLVLIGLHAVALERGRAC